jgi:FAD/FMN-containing dehydrogenase
MVSGQFLSACAAIIGAPHVLTGAQAEPFEQDFWRQNRGRSAAVLRPSSREEVAGLVALCAGADVAIVAQGGNTGLVNGGIPDGTGSEILLSLSRLNRLRKIDPAGDYLIAEAGCILADVQMAALSVERYFPLTLGAEGSCTIGGTIATNAGGSNVLRYGMTRDLVLGLEAVMADGSLLDLLRPLRKDNTGYDLKQLFIGSEGTLGIVTAACLRLVAPPRERVSLWLALDSPQAAVNLFRHLRGVFGDLLSCFELIASFGVETALSQLAGLRRPVREPHAWHLLVEIAWSFSDGLMERALGALQDPVATCLYRDCAVAQTVAQRQNMWRIREGQSEAASKLGAIVRSDVTVPIADIPALIERVEAKALTFGREVFVLPFGHVGDGNLHMNFVVPAGRLEELSPRLLEELYREVDRLGGSISAEHGVGRAKREAVARRKPVLALDLMRRLKRTLDPDNRLNPGVVLAVDGLQSESTQINPLQDGKTRA